MHSTKIPLRYFAIFYLIFVGILYIFIFSVSNSSNSPSSISNLTTRSFPADELDLALEEASTPDKTVIIAIVNDAYAEQSLDSETTMLDLFLESFWLGEDTQQLLDHLLLVAIDQVAYERCRFKRLHCYWLVTDGVGFQGEKFLNSDAFLQMTWTRTRFLLHVLKRGYNFIFTDADVMWLRNPFTRLNQNDVVDLQISLDITSEKPMMNTGFYFVRSNNKTISLFDIWYSMKDYSEFKKEQDILVELAQDGLFLQLGLRVQFLETRYFSGFCEESDDITKVVTVHANCCHHINSKLQDLTVVLRDWKRFVEVVTVKGTAVGNVTANFRWSNHVGCLKAWGKSENGTLPRPRAR